MPANELEAVPPPPPEGPAPAVVVVLGPKVPIDDSEDLAGLVANNLSLLGPLQEFLARNEPLRGTRLVTAISLEELLAMEERARDSDFPPLESLARFWRFDLTGYSRIKTPEELVEELEAPERERPADERGVARAYVESTAEDPAALPQLTMQTGQGWLRPRPEGVNAWAAWDHEGGHGDTIRVVDVEQGWQFTHPDLAGRVTTPQLVHDNRFDTRQGAGSHGTSVLGLIVGRPNGVGGTGIAKGATVAVSSHFDGSGIMRTVDAILVARNNLGSGDILLIEVHLPYLQYLCAEADDAVFHALRLAAAAGIVIVEAAGNGLTNISTWQNAAGRTLSRDVPEQDSGAIVVGSAVSVVDTVDGTAGHHLNQTALTNYGDRVDCYAWGDGVEAPIVDSHGPFGGTSAAAAIIAGVAAAVQGMRVAANKPRLETKAMRTLLRDTPGTPQVPVGVAASIGVMPDLGALAAAVGAVPVQPATGSSTVTAVPDGLVSNS